MKDLAGALLEQLQRMRDDMVELLSRETGDHMSSTLGRVAEEVRARREILSGADEYNSLLVRAREGAADRSASLGGGDLPDGVQRLMTRIRTAGADADTTTRTEQAVLDKYQEQLRVRERTLRQEFLNNRAHGLRQLGETPEAADAVARSEVDEYLRGERAQHLIHRDAAANTTEWADKLELPRVLDEVATSPRALGPQHVDDILERLATQADRDEQLPKGLNRVVARIENSEADPRAVADAKSLLRARYQEYRQQPMTNTYRETLLERRAEFARNGFPPHVADRLALRGTEAFTQTAKAQRMIDSVAANNTSQWFDKMAAAADRDGVTIADHLAEINHYEQQPLSEPELRAAGDRITAMHERLDAAQRDLDSLLERSPGLAEKGADRWQAGIDTHRDIATRLSDAVRTRTAAGQPVTRRMINDAALQGPEAGIRGYAGEIRMAQQLDNIRDVGPLVDVEAPTGTRMASEVDIVTDEGRTWHEVKTNNPASQRANQRDLEAQARRQLVISHMNREYWVDGKPPELKMHFMNGVHPTVKSRIEALRIEDETGRVVEDHRIEVIDES